MGTLSRMLYFNDGAMTTIARLHDFTIHDITTFLGFDTPLMGRRARYGVGLRRFFSC